MLVAQNSLGSVCPVPLTVRGTVVHAPAEVLVEGRGFVEHPDHARSARGVPRTDVLVEGRGVAEHTCHVRDAVDGPITNVSVEGLGVEVISLRN